MPPSPTLAGENDNQRLVSLFKRFFSRSDEEMICGFVVGMFGELGFGEGVGEVAVNFVPRETHIIWIEISRGVGDVKSGEAKFKVVGA
jgi:hypothetical protein